MRLGAECDTKMPRFIRGVLAPHLPLSPRSPVYDSLLFLNVQNRLRDDGARRLIKEEQVPECKQPLRQEPTWSGAIIHPKRSDLIKAKRHKDRLMETDSPSNTLTFALRVWSGARKDALNDSDKTEGETYAFMGPLVHFSGFRYLRNPIRMWYKNGSKYITILIYVPLLRKNYLL